jgi:hypothetical protein
LILLAPILAELLFGTTRLTTIFVLVPQIGTWGCAGLLIRELARRRGAGWLSILLLGFALAIAEECVLQQTSLAPLVGSDPEHPYGRAFGVNWIYFLWAFVYESVWVAIVPIQLAELIHRDRRHEPWLGKRGIVITSVIFALASFIAWFLWIQVFIPKFFPALVYKVPLPAVAMALTVIVLLIIASLAPQWPSLPGPDPARSVPTPLIVGLTAFLLALPWFALIFLAYGAAPAVPAIVPFVLGLAWSALALIRFLTWCARPGWSDHHRLASITGALLASMLAGFPILFASHSPLIDVLGKFVLNLIAVALLLRLTRMK